MKKIRGMNRKILQWQEQAGKLQSRRKCKKYRDTSVRYLKELAHLKPLARKLAEELEARIQEEMKFSEEEVKTFQDQLKSEREELERIGRELEKVEEKLKAEEELAAGLQKGEEKPSTKKIKEKVAKDKDRAKKLKKEEKRETESVATLKRELESEKVDEEIFQRDTVFAGRRRGQLCGGRVDDAAEAR